MYITTVSLTNVRCYEDVTIECGAARTSILICGNNGSGKSSFLRSIAMGLCDQASAGALLRDLPGDFIRKTSRPQNVREAKIQVGLARGSGASDQYSIETRLETNSYAIFETVRQETTPQGEFPWSDIFVTGYGAGLRTQGSEDYMQYFAPDAVYSLFQYAYPLQSPELAWRRLLDAAPEDKKIAANATICAALKEILELSDDDDLASIEHNGVFIRSAWGKHELNALGDGYQALVTITLDILSWKLLSINHRAVLSAYETNDDAEWQPILNTRELDGIVIIDEVEKHLHPKLQHQIIYHLKSVFPKIQFIISTHSPLCVSGTADLPSGSFRIFKTCRDSSGAIGLEPMGIPTGMSADEIYDKYFEVGDTRNTVLQNSLEQYRRLYLKDSRTAGEQQELEELERHLQTVIGNNRGDLHEATRQRIEQRLNALIDELKNEHDQD